MFEAIMNLSLSMIHRRDVHLMHHTLGYVVSGICNQIQAEDGSGSSFNIHLDSGVVVYLKRPCGRGTPESPIQSA